MKKKVLSLVLALAMLVSLMTPAFAADASAFPDVDGHWAQSSIERWSAAGVLNGKGDGFDPDAGMTRAEFAQMLVNLLGYTEKAENTFKDVPDDAWYADAVLKLAAAGVMQGDGVNANPNAEISRAEMAVLLCRALNIEPKSSSGLNFADAGSVPSWAEGAMAALAERGMISGVGGNQVAPTLSVNRASVAKLLDNIVGVYANEPGQVISGEVKGLVIVVADNVVLEDATVAENIVVAPKAGDASLTVTGKSTVGDVYISADGAKLTVDKDAAAGDILVDAAKAAVTVDGKADALMTTENATAAALSVGGTVSDVSLAGADSELKVSGTVKNVDISATASGADVNVAKGGSIDTVKTSADDVKIAGEGTVKTVEVAAGSGVAVDTKGTEVKVSENAETVLVNGKEVKPGETANAPSGSGGGGGGGGGTDPSVTEYTVYFDAGNEVYFARQTVTAGGKATAPDPAPTKEGYTFGGWFKDAACTQAWDFANDTVTGNTTLYAKWTEKPVEKIYTITFNAVGGTLSNTKDIYTFHTTVGYDKPADPTKAGYTFKGWYTNDGYTGEPASFPVADENLANVTYFAKWESVLVAKVDKTMYDLDAWLKTNVTGDLLSVTKEGSAYSMNIDLDALHASSTIGGLDGLATKLAQYIGENFGGTDLVMDGKEIYTAGAINHTALKDVLFGTLASKLIPNFVAAPTQDGILYSIPAKLTQGASTYSFTVQVKLTGEDLTDLAAAMAKIGENLAITYEDASKFTGYGVTGESKVAVITVVTPDAAMQTLETLGDKAKFDAFTVEHAINGLGNAELSNVVGSYGETILNLCGLVNSNDALVNKVLSKVTDVTVSYNKNYNGTGAANATSWNPETATLIADNAEFKPGENGDNWKDLISGVSGMLDSGAKATHVGAYYAKEATITAGYPANGSLYIIPVHLHLDLDSSFGFVCDETIVVQLIVPFSNNT